MLKRKRSDGTNDDVLPESKRQKLPETQLKQLLTELNALLSKSIDYLQDMRDCEDKEIKGLVSSIHHKVFYLCYFSSIS